MLIGMMNHPQKAVLEEAKWAASNEFGFLDLSIEGPEADLNKIDASQLRQILDDSGMHVVGHTAWFLPFSSPFSAVRTAAIECFCETLPVFASVGAKWVNVHAGQSPRMFSKQDSLKWQSDAFAELGERAASFGLQVMVEHPPHAEIGLEEMKILLAGDARLGLHLDIAHAHVGTVNGLELTKNFINSFGSRLAHVHLSDNKLKSDDHLPLGAGLIRWRECLQYLRQSGYDHTVTLEVFTPDESLLLHSKELLISFIRQE